MVTQVHRLQPTYNESHDISAFAILAINTIISAL